MRSRLRVTAVLQGALAGISVLSLRIPFLAIGHGLEVLDDPTIVTKQSDLSPAFVSKLLLASGVVYGLIGLGLALTAGTICVLAWRRRNYRLCRKACFIQCLCIPVGTAAGALTLVLLSKAAVQAAFDEPLPAPEDESGN